MFHYLGNERLQFGFFSPNVCAAFLVITLLLTVGLFLLSVRQRGVWPKVMAGAFGFAALLQMMMIAATYSRGGYVAGLTALTGAALLCRRRWSWVFPTLFLMVLLFTGSGASRIKSVGDISDGSIRNRLILWHYGTGIIAGHWLAGTPEPGKYYTDFYQPLWLNERYYSLINDYLTIAARYGIFALFGILTALFWLFQYGFRLYLTTRNELLLYALAALGGYVIAGCFTTCYRFPSIWGALGILLLLLAGFLIRGFRQKKFTGERLYCWTSPALAALICILLLIYGAIVNFRLPYAKKAGTFENQPVLTLAPKGPAHGNMVIFASPNENRLRTLSRPLSERGFAVSSLPIDRGLKELPLARRYLAAPSIEARKPSFLLGVGEERAIQAIALADAETLRGVIAVDPPLDWPFEELSPREQLCKAKVPLHLILSSERSADEEAFHALAGEYGIDLTVTILKPGNEADSIAAIVDWCKLL